MTAKKNAARVAVEAAALPATAATQVKPRDVFDCIAMGISREDWEFSLNSDEARAWNTWLAQDKRESWANKPQSMPTVQQVMRLACAMVTDSLKKTLKHADAFDDWCDGFGDAISTAELAMMAVERLADTLSSGLDLDTFNTTWWRASAAVRLARETIPYKDSLIWRFINFDAKEFEVLAAAVEFASFCQDEKGEGNAA